MRKNIWIKNEAISQARKLINYRKLSEFITEMLIKDADNWLRKKLQDLMKSENNA